MKNAMSVLDLQLLDTLTKPGFRLPILSDWLQREVWTIERYQGEDKNPTEYLLQGERLVNEREKLLTMAGESIYEELAAEPPKDRCIKMFLDQNPGGAVVIFSAYLDESNSMCQDISSKKSTFLLFLIVKSYE